MSLIIPANTLASGGFAVDNSCRFNDGSSDYLTISSGTPTNDKKFTVSAWVKRSSPNGVSQVIWHNSLNGDNYKVLNFSAEEQLWYNDILGGDYQANIRTNRLFRDVGAWYHIVLSVDTTQGTEANRVKLYVNGVQETSFATATYPDLNDVVGGTSSYTGTIGRFNPSTNQYFDGYMAEIVLVDGTQNAVTDFGEFDEDSGIWKPIDVSGLTFGTNGFYLDFEDSAALGDDVSGNGNDFTVNNLTAIDQTTDTPTNNFATLNPLLGIGIGSYSEGNLKIGGVSGNWSTAFSTIAVTQGKWYVEGKSLSTSMMAGVISTDQAHNVINDFQGKQSRGWGYESTGRLWNNASDTVSWGSTYTTNDIIGVALDLDNNRLFFSKNGVFQNSGDPTSSTGAISIPSGYEWYIAYSPVDSTAQQWELNFGNPPFTISSGNSDGAGFGNFEYSVPSGYYALNTKNLAEYG